MRYKVSQDGLFSAQYLCNTEMQYIHWKNNVQICCTLRDLKKHLCAMQFKENHAYKPRPQTQIDPFPISKSSHKSAPYTTGTLPIQIM